QIHAHHRPRAAQTKQMLIQIFAFHRCSPWLDLRDSVPLYPHKTQTDQKIFDQHVDECLPIIVALTKSWEEKIVEQGIATGSVRIRSATHSKQIGEDEYEASVVSTVLRIDKSLPDAAFNLASSLLIQASNELWQRLPRIAHIGFTYMHDRDWNRL
ncbi:MAG: hypothetical protein ACHP7O_13375, partial [Burkholderiales bacterium]